MRQKSAYWSNGIGLMAYHCGESFPDMVSTRVQHTEAIVVKSAKPQKYHTTGWMYKICVATDKRLPQFTPYSTCSFK